MTRGLAGIVAAGAFTLLTVGAAGPVLGQGPTPPKDDLRELMTEHMKDAPMGSMTDAMMSGSMMGAGSSEMPMGPGTSPMPMDPDEHAAHHALLAPEATR